MTLPGPSMHRAVDWDRPDWGGHTYEGLEITGERVEDQ